MGTGWLIGLCVSQPVSSSVTPAVYLLDSSPVTRRCVFTDHHERDVLISRTAKALKEAASAIGVGPAMALRYVL